MSRSFWTELERPDNLPVVVLLPALALVFGWWLRVARRNDRQIEVEGLDALARTMRGPVPPPRRDLGRQEPERVHTWPHLLRVEVLVTLVVLIVLLVWSIVLDAPLEQEADPSRTPNPSKAPWYFLGLQELLVYFDPWIAGVALPCLIVLGLCAIPYLDVNPEGDGYYSWKNRRFALTTFWSGLLLWVVLIVIGTFLRGPGWGWFWPWERWIDGAGGYGASRTWAELCGVADPTWGSLLGGITVLAYFGLGVAAWRRVRHKPTFRKLGAGRFALLAFLWLSMLGIPLKMGLHLLLGVKYVWVTPWFRI